MNLAVRIVSGLILNHVICLQTFGHSELEVIMLRNKTTETYVHNIINTSVVVNVAPFAFIHDQESVLVVDSFYFGQSIQRRSLRSPSTNDLVVDHVHGTQSVNYDWVGQNIYWIQSNIIEVSDVHGNHRKTLYWKNIYHLNEMVLEPNQGFMFWTDEGGLPKVERAAMDGNASSRTVIIKDNLEQPYGLTLDTSQQLLYWSDGKLHIIERCDYNGYNRFIVLSLNTQKPGNIDLYKDILYWIEEYNHTVNAFDMTSNTRSLVAQLPTEMLQGVHKEDIFSLPYSIEHFQMHVFDNTILTEEYSATHGFNQSGDVQCDHLSLVSPIWPFYKCLCSANYIIGNDGKCREDEEIPSSIFISTTDGFIEYNGTCRVFDDIVAEHFILLEDENIMYDAGQLELFTSTLRSISAGQKLVNKPQKQFTWYLEYDWITENVYWGYNAWEFCMILVLKHNEQNEWINMELFKDVGVVSFNIDPTKQYMFYGTDQNLFRMSMNGDPSTRQILIGAQSAAITFMLTLDIMDEVIYWEEIETDWDSAPQNFIYRCDYKGNLLRGPYKRTFTIAIHIFDKYKIVSEYETDFKTSLQVCNKEFGGDCKRLCENENFITFDMKMYPELRQLVENPCAVNNGNCSDFCLMTYIDPYYTCACQLHQFMLPDNRTCAFHPCKVNNGNCSMVCVAEESAKFHCNCSDGFYLASDGRNCMGDMGLTLIQGIVNGWRLIDVKTFTTLSVFTDKLDISEMVFDPTKRKIYWIHTETSAVSSITKSKLDGTDQDVIVVNNEDIMNDLAYDWMRGDIYWSTKSSLWMKYTNETSHISLDELLESKIDMNADELPLFRIIYAIVLDIFNGNIYWTWLYMQENTSNQEFISFIECMPVTNFRRRRQEHFYLSLVKYKDLAYSGFTLNSLENKLYYTYVYLVDGAAAINGTLSNSDGSGTMNIGNLPLHSENLVLLGDHLYLDVDDKLLRIHKDNFSMEIIKIPKQGGSFKFMTGVNLNRKESKALLLDCKEYEKCWSWDNAWICLNSDQICDGISDCYEGDDEQYCNVCDQDCMVQNLKIICYDMIFSSSKPHEIGLKDYLNWTSHPLSHMISLYNVLSYDCSIEFEISSEKPNHIKFFRVNSIHNVNRLRQLVRSTLFYKLDHVKTAYLTGNPLLVDLLPNGLSLFKNMMSFKLENSLVTRIPTWSFNRTTKLKSLIFEHNSRLTMLEYDCFWGLIDLENLKISGSYLRVIDGGVFKYLENLRYLNLSFSSISILGVGLMDNLKYLQMVDLRGNDIKLTSNLFTHTTVLEQIFCDSFTLCCIKPVSVSDGNCSASKDDISSCSNLIESRTLAAFLWLLGLMAGVGNVSILIYRGFIDRSILVKSYFIFIYNLGIADFMMAMYMLIVAYHDAMYDGIYVWNDYTWKRSIFCRLSGTLSMISSESSMMFVCLITLERFLCAKFAFGNVRISKKNAVLISILVWMIAVGLALIPIFAYPEFYLRSGVCIGIPLTKNNDTGLEYSTFIFLGLNFLFSFIIPFGQYYIYRAVKKSSEGLQSNQRGRNLAVAKRLAFVVITNCMCWLPVGILIILSLSGTKTPRDVYAWVIIFVLPINAAVNPYLYTLTDLNREKMKKFFRCRNADKI